MAGKVEDMKSSIGWIDVLEGIVIHLMYQLGGCFWMRLTFKSVNFG